MKPQIHLIWMSNVDFTYFLIKTIFVFRINEAICIFNHFSMKNYFNHFFSICPLTGEMMMSLLWYYRPEHTEQGRQSHDADDEVFASRHQDHNSVACIEDKCYVLTFNEYCR